MNSRLLKLNKFEEIMFQNAFLQILFSHQLRKSIEPHMQLNIIDSAKQKKAFLPFQMSLSLSKEEFLSGF